MKAQFKFLLKKKILTHKLCHGFLQDQRAVLKIPLKQKDNISQPAIDKEKKKDS